MANSTIKRTVPFPLKLIQLFGGVLNQFGWIFFTFGMIFVWAFALNVDFSFLYYNIADIEYTQGKLEKAEGTNSYINDEQVLKYTYTFTGPNGKELQAESYSTKMFPPEKMDVTIEYPVGKPGYSRVRGMRRDMFGPLVLLVLIFPLVGLVCILIGTRKGIRARRLLRTGVLTEGRLVSKKETNIEVNEQTVYKVTFVFVAHDTKKYYVSEKTHTPYLLQDDPQEKLLYDPRNPGHAMMVDTMPGGPVINTTQNNNGVIETVSPVKALLVVIVPVLSLLGNAIVAVLMLN
ncbi:MAG: hypothetical protein GY754_23635 [bacterium]|nr:hypothetical protein [bacterium]